MASSAPPQPRTALRPLGLAASEQDHPSRLVEAMIMALTEKSYAEVTIADVVRHARVSKRTFYEHFPDKESCFLAAYTAVSNELLARIAVAIAQESGIEAQVSAAARAYFSSLESNPGVTRTFLSEIHAAGPAALALRRTIHQRFADALRNLVDAQRMHMTGVRPLSRELATALVGGINELVMLAIEEGRADRLQDTAHAAVELIWAVLKTLVEPPLAPRS